MKPLYIHFVDRELLRAHDLYGSISERRVQEDLFCALLASSEVAYVSGSVIFESDYGFSLFERHPELLASPDVLQVGMMFPNIKNLIDHKRHAYDHDRQGYVRYFTDDWKGVEDLAPGLMVKIHETTSVLKEALVEGLRQNHARGVGLAPVRGALPPALIDGVESLISRTTRPVTIDLFESLLSSHNVSREGRTQLAAEISTQYVRSYIADYDGTIATGLSCGIGQFDSLSTTWPFHDLRIWRRVFLELGCYSVLRDPGAAALIEIRRSPIHSEFITMFRNVLSSLVPVSLRSDTVPGTPPPTPRLTAPECEALWVGLRSARRTRAGSVAAWVLDSMATAVRAFQAKAQVTGAQTRRTQRAQEAFLAKDRSALVIGGSQIINLDEEMTNVLDALMRAKRLVADDGLPALLTSREVAALYQGADPAREEAEARRVCDQFVRQFRRKLKGVDAETPDYLVKRVYGKGIAPGVGWARRPVRGAGEAGLHFRTDPERVARHSPKEDD